MKFDVPITPKLLAEHNLTDAEYRTILEILGRVPNIVELGIFSAMWSEHCSYKSSRIHLRKFPTEGPRVIEGPGENAGVVDIGDGLAVVFKMESHNHPSFIEPFQGAATGVGGILRDVFTMGARPIALLDPLFFGDLEAPRMRHLVDGVVRGIGGYGNCMGIPTLGGSTAFHPSYDGNILVNVFALGIARPEAIFLGRAAGPGNPVIYVGSKTGRDGIHGAKMASETFTEESEHKRPTVQVGDPFTEKLLLEACLELFRTDACVGIQDMGAAGLTSSCFEMAGRAGTGVRLDLSKVPMRETGMTPYELMLSESQERMLLVAEKGREGEVLAIFHKWDLEGVVLGEVTETGRVELFWEGERVADLPAAPLSDRAPVYERPIARPTDLDARNDGSWRSLPDLAAGEAGSAFRRLLLSPAFASKRWIWEQYDHMVRTNTVAGGGPGGDAAVIRVKESGGEGKPTKGVAISCDVNPLLCSLDPCEGARGAVAEAARNLACVGAEPIGLTDCLNFGSPEVPEIMWQFAESIRGLCEGCRALDIPVVSGNVSFYNQTGEAAILPTPSIGVVGLLPDVTLAVGHRWRREGEVVVLVGAAGGRNLGGSAFLRLIHGIENGPIPKIDFDHERALGAALRELAAGRALSSAHDVSDGGLALCLAEASFGSGGLGVEVDLPGGGRLDAVLFGEEPGRAVLSMPEGAVAAARLLFGGHGLDFVPIGRVSRGRLAISIEGRPVVDEPLDPLERDWERAFPALVTRGREAVEE
jgi:phosphoribosylformylglycinamidine synthase